MFSCVWLHFKKCFEKYFLMFGCVFENTIENTFSHIFSVAKRIYNIIHSSKHKQNPKKNHQIRTLRTIAIGMVGASCNRGRHFTRSRSTLRVIGAVPVMSTDDIGELGFGQSLLSLLSFSLSLSFSHSLSLLRVTQKWFECKMKV